MFLPSAHSIDKSDHFTEHLVNIIHIKADLLERLPELNEIPETRGKHKDILKRDTSKYNLTSPVAALVYIEDRIKDLNKCFERAIYDEDLVQEVANAIEEAKNLGADVSNVQKQYDYYLYRALPLKEICESTFKRPNPMNNREYTYIMNQYSKINKEIVR